jgi:hypothetical protein
LHPAVVAKYDGQYFLERRMRILSLSVAAFIAASAGAHATDMSPILPRSSSGNAGFVISAGGWDEDNSAHADDVYRALKKQKGAEPGAFDFYYQMIAARQYQPKQGWCNADLDVGTFLQGVFGTSQGAFAALKLNLNYVYDAGVKVAFFGTDSPILMLGRGQAAGAVTPGNGCFFQISPAFQTALYRYSGGGQDQDRFTFDFGVVGGRATNLNAVSVVFGLFDKFNAAYNIATLKAGQESAIQSAANSFQTAIQVTIRGRTSNSTICGSNGSSLCTRKQRKVPASRTSCSAHFGLSLALFPRAKKYIGERITF